MAKASQNLKKRINWSDLNFLVHYAKLELLIDTMFLSFSVTLLTILLASFTMNIHSLTKIDFKMITFHHWCKPNIQIDNTYSI